MDTTLIVFEKKAQTNELCELIAKVLGPSICVQPLEFNGDFNSHSKIAIVFPLDEGRIPLHISRFIGGFAAELQTKKVAFVCLSGNRVTAGRALKSVSHGFSGNVVFSTRVPIFIRPKAGMTGASRAISDEVTDKLIALKRVLSDSTDMPQDRIMAHVEEVLLSHNTCVLCTANDGGARATPIAYVYRNGALFFLSEGGEKFARLYANPQVNIAVFDAYSSFDKLLGVQIEGRAEMIETFSDEYIDFIESKGLTEEKLRKLPVALNLFKVLPERIEILDSGFANEEFEVKEVWKR
jgi:hypothetical protein